METGMSSGSKRPMQPDELTQYDQKLVKRVTSSQEGTSKQPEGKTESLDANKETKETKYIQLEKLFAELQTEHQRLSTKCQGQSLQNATLRAHLAESIQMIQIMESQRDEMLEFIEALNELFEAFVSELHATNAQKRELNLRIQRLTRRLLVQKQLIIDQNRDFVQLQIEHDQQLQQERTELQQVKQQLSVYQQAVEEFRRKVTQPMPQQLEEDEKDSVPSTHTPSESETTEDQLGRL